MSKGGSGGRLLLLAEDHEDTGIFFKRLFDKIAPDWRMAWARDGVAAFEFITEQEFPDILMTDLDMPGLTGFDLIKRLRGMACPRHIPIIVYSCSDGPEVRMRCRSLGADEFLPKNMATADLREAILRVMSGLETGSATPRNNRKEEQHDHWNLQTRPT